MSPPRLFVDADLAEDLVFDLADGQAHYLGTVLRRAAGDAVALFNGRHGEWEGQIAAIGKGRCRVRLRRRLRAQEAESPLHLVFAPVKRARIDYLVEKATELGVASLTPVATERTVVERINRERLRAHAVEAAEQSERLTVPVLHEPRGLPALLADWPAGRPLFLCDESGAAPGIGTVLAGFAPPPAGAAMLTGPEGGFTDSELDALTKLPFVKPVGLGPRVLRADTAALAALAVFQALAGDWRQARLRRAPAALSPHR
ncbi:MAG TPA: 16S rRNA (uracil(1498)-N(3))-methyltransferase [Stellaceae bacterium]|nr:16S rRNA (uracil(1498)-N(3))-methyltransferase [Stellaceae bacterium]